VHMREKVNKERSVLLPSIPTAPYPYVQPEAETVPQV
jgi:hypothetical protein